jgi:hypothetical protein
MNTQTKEQPISSPKIKDLLQLIATACAGTGLSEDSKLVCQVIPYLRDGTAWSMNFEVLGKEDSDALVLNFINEKLTILPNVATVAVEHSGDVRYLSEGVIRQIFRALDYFGNYTTYEAPRTGGVLAGCPRGEPVGADILVYEARYAMRQLLAGLDEIGSNWKWLDEYRASKLPEEEVGELKQLLKEAARHLKEHNAEYHHRTPAEFIQRLEKATGKL